MKKLLQLTIFSLSAGQFWLAIPLFFLLLLQAHCALAVDILILQSGTLKPYVEATKGVYSVLQEKQSTQGPKSLLALHIEKIVIDGVEGSTDTSWQYLIEKHRPSVIVAVGSKALRIAVSTKNIPVVYLITPRPDEIIGGRKHVSGVSMIVPPLSSLRKLHKHFPEIRRLSILYNPQYSRSFIAEARQAADLFRYELNEIPIDSLEEVPQALASLDNSTEALWMIPDPHVVSSQTVPAFLSYSFRNNVMLLTFAKKYLEMGATFVVTPDTFHMGETAGRLAMTYLGRTTPPPTTPVTPLAFHVFQNKEVLAKMAGLKKSLRQKH